MTSVDELAGAAPTAILRKRLIEDAEEILVLTYTCDLSFFERVCLPEARSVRARTTVLFDAAHLTAAPTEPGFADYLALPVECKDGGAFHPKLLVIASEQDAIVAIGSGNATASGWHHNAEIWTLMRADGPTVPRCFHDLADWLRRLPAVVWMEELATERLARVAELLTARPAEESDNEPVLVTSDRRPIIDQLAVPADAVTELAVSAPFFDPRAAALARLVELFDPPTLKLLLTNDVQCDRDKLAAVTASLPGSAAMRVQDDRYYHAKIVEWSTCGDRWALTGSANCSQAGLTLSMPNRGNCELGLVSRIATTVVGSVPSVDINLLDDDHLWVRHPDPERESGEPLRVLGVRIRAGRVTVTLLGPQDARPSEVTVAGLRLDHESSNGRLHVYSAEADADWVNAMAESATTTVVTDDGSELRDALVTDVDAALTRISRPSPLEHTPFHTLIGDPVLTAALVEALTDLAAVRPDSSAGPRSGAKRRRRAEERITTAVGAALLRFALGLSFTTVTTSVDIAEVEGDDTEQPAVGESGMTTPAPTSKPAATQSAVDALTDSQRGVLRAMMWRLLDESVDWPVPAKLAAGRVVLLIAASGLWTDAEDWADAACTATTNVFWTDEDPVFGPEQAAFCVVGLVATRRGLDSCDKPPHELLAHFDELRQAFTAFPDFIDTARDDILQRYVTGLDGPIFGVLFDRTDFAEEIAWILGRSPLQEAVDAIEGASLGTDLIVRLAATKDPGKTAIRLLDTLRRFPDVHVVTYTATEVHGWWNGSRLLLVKRQAAVWRAEVWHRLPLGIAMYAQGETRLRPADRRWTTESPELAYAELTQSDAQP